MNIIVKSFESDQVFREKSYLLISGSKALLIDPGADPDLLIKEILSGGYQLLGVLATHGHMDHILSAKPLCERFSCPFFMHSGDRSWLEDLQRLCACFYLKYHGTPGLSVDLAEHESLDLHPFHLKILHTPGHSAGSVCFLIEDMLFSGDTLFRHSIGRTDLHGGNSQQLLHSIRKKILTLPDKTKVYPGHMEMTNIVDEKCFNPYLQI